ncbi:MAG: hypothetical protein LBS23_01585 [Holosporaceae bacterium]|jgi:BirA family biotin operon repressor/biotin-[acetyl-CoA-carboxylase] ligase|nr:hypothetical protein [Holosporaceae bacterium]
MAIIDSWLVISIGINIKSAPFKQAISMREILGLDKINFAPQDMLECILKNIEEWTRCSAEKGFFYIRSYWLRYINEINCKVIIKNGSESISGIFAGIDEFGRLILENDRRKLFISSGDMFVNTKNITVFYE